MKYLFFLLSLLLTCVSYSQNFVVEYDYYYKKKDSEVTYNKPSILKVTPNFSLYKIISNDSLGITREEVPQKEGGNNIIIKSNKSRFIYKDIKKNTFISKEKILFEEFVTIDSLNVFNWDLDNSVVKNILGFNCNKASLNYRGRKYIAYYTIEIPSRNGPFKFHGLPGLILEIRAVDEESIDFKITAVSFKVVDDEKKLNIYNPFSNTDKIYSWEEYLKVYKQKYEEYKSYNSGNDVNINLPKGNIEIIIND
jgi:GLPGLI family protein